MKNENEKLDQFFDNKANQWDIKQLSADHEDRFLNKLKDKKLNKKRLRVMYIAASIAVLIGITLTYRPEEKKADFTFASKETKETDSIFTVLISNQLQEIKERRSPENEKIVSDALKQMKLLDTDYNKIIQELKNNGENKLIIKALISNLQTRISFLQNVLMHIESKETINTIIDEKTI
jgi:hypothetical protein